MTSLQNAPSALDRLPPDQRAVLQMVLVRGKSYEEIAKLLSIDRAAVRQRALQAFDALGPTTRVPAQRRGRITDYLLGALSAQEAKKLRATLAESATERAWARVVASELGPLSREPLPEIPVGMVEQEPEPARGRSRRSRRKDQPVRATGASETEKADGAAPSRPEPVPVAEVPPRGTSTLVEPTADERSAPRVSRLGGGILLGGVAAVVIALIVIFVVIGVGGGGRHIRTVARHGGTISGANARPLAQINLMPPSGGKAAGIAEVIKAGSRTGVVIVASGLAPTTGHEAYAVWLSNSSTSFVKLGYVQQPVTSSGRLETAGALPPNASSFKNLIVTLQSGPSNKPGTVVLQGPVSGV